LTVIKPNENTARSIRAARGALLRNHVAQAGLWTIETGEKFAGLHLNIISTKPTIPKIRGATSWSAQLETSARIAAAYIAKQSGMPDTHQFDGRLYGTFGAFADIVTGRQMPSVVVAASLQVAMRPVGGPLTRSERREFAELAARKEYRSAEEYREIARTHLPDIFAALRK